MYRLLVYTLLIIYEVIDVCTARYMDHSTLYRLLIIKNHMTLSLFLVESVKCDFYTIRDISIHFTYGNGCTQIMYIFYTLVINKMRSVC